MNHHDYEISKTRSILSRDLPFEEMSIKTQEEVIDCLKKENFDLKLRLYHMQKENQRLLKLLENNEKAIQQPKNPEPTLRERCKKLEKEISIPIHDPEKTLNGFNGITKKQEPTTNGFKNQDKVPENLKDSREDLRQRVEKMNESMNRILSNSQEKLPKVNHNLNNIPLKSLKEEPVITVNRNDQDLTEIKTIECQIKSDIRYPMNKKVILIEENCGKNLKVAEVPENKIAERKEHRIHPKTRYFFGCMSSTEKDEKFDTFEYMRRKILQHSARNSIKTNLVKQSKSNDDKKSQNLQNPEKSKRA